MFALLLLPITLEKKRLLVGFIAKYNLLLDVGRAYSSYISLFNIEGKGSKASIGTKYL